MIWMTLNMYTDQVMITQILHLAQSIAVLVGLTNGLAKFNSITSPDQWVTSSKVSLVRCHYFHQLTRPLPVHSRGRYSLPFIP